VSGVAAHPMPFDLVRRGGLFQALP
jgi:hypothetical protein